MRCTPRMRFFNERWAHEPGGNANPVEVEMTMSRGGSTVKDTVRIGVTSADLDIDSDNDNALDPPGRTVEEDHLEEQPMAVWAELAEQWVGAEGKVLVVNDNDTDGDSVIDSLDGYDRDGIPDGVSAISDDTVPGEQFVPMKFSLTSGIDVSRAKVWFGYPEDDPDPNLFPSPTPPITGHIRLWSKPGSQKRNWKQLDAGGDFIKSGKDYAISAFGGGTEVTIWVEATVTSKRRGDIAIAMFVDPDGDGPEGRGLGYVLSDSVRATAERLAVFWQAQSLSVSKTNLDANPHLNGGLRIFPDKDGPTDTIVHDVVNVEASITPPPLTTREIFFQSYDVDDPHAFVAGQPAGQQIDPNDTATSKRGLDNFGQSPGQRGRFLLAGTNYCISSNTNPGGKATVAFQVTMQPGDNFRIGAALTGPELDSITDDSVTPDNKPVKGFNGALTDMLTVWRRLWVERDAMTGANVNLRAVPIAGVRTAPYPGRTTPLHWLKINADVPNHEFEGGSLNIPALGKTLPIATNTNEFGGGQELVVRTTDLTATELATLAAGGVLGTIADDDDPAVLGWAGLPRLASGGTLLESAYRQMYVLPLYADKFNTRTTVSFDRHVDYLDLVGGSSLDNSRDLPNENGFWSSLLVSAFEPAADVDADADGSWLLGAAINVVPEQAEYGLTPKSNFIDNLSIIFLETIRDMKNATTDEAHTVVHELGHAGRDDAADAHPATGIMRETAPRGETEFDTDTQRRIRSKVLW